MVDDIDETLEETNAVDGPAPEVKTEEAKAVVSTQGQVERSLIGLDDKGLLAPKDQREAWRIAQIFLDSRAIPKQFVNVAQVFMARQFLLGHGLNPEIGIRQTTIINGTLSIWGDLPKALVERSGLMESFDEYWIDKDYNKICLENKNLHLPAWASICITKRKGRDPITRTFNLDQAKNAGLLNKDSPWKTYPDRMLQMRARSHNLKDNFSDVLSGCAIGEYDYNTTLETGGVPYKPVSNIAHELNSTFIEKDATPVEGNAQAG